MRKHKVYKKKVLRPLCVALAGMCIMTGISGCTKDPEETETEAPTQAAIDPATANSTVILKVADQDVTYAEYNLFLIQKIYMNSLSGTQTDSTTVSGEVLDEIRLEMVEYQMAEVTEGVEVTASELSAYQANADSFFEFFGEDFLKRYGITKETVDELYRKEAYINAMTNHALSDLKKDYEKQFYEEYPDIKFHTVYVAFFPTYQTNENGSAVVDAEGNTIALSEEECAEVEQRADDFVKRLQQDQTDGKTVSVEELAKEFEIDKFSDFDRDYKYQFGVYNDSIEALENGEFAGPLKNVNGYMVVQMIDSDDEDFEKYQVDYLTSNNASGMLPTLQQNWVAASGVTQEEPDEIVKKTDISALYAEMTEKGYLSNGGKE